MEVRDLMDSEILKATEELMQIREAYEKASAEKTRLDSLKKQAEYKLFNLMESQEIQSFKHEIYGTVFKSSRVWCKVTDFDKVCRFLKERGLYDEIMKVEPRTGRLNQLVKAEFLDKDGVIPEAEIGISVTLSPMVGNRQPRGGGTILVEEPEGL